MSSSIGLSGMSQISESTMQQRYQKALKQINKLIEMNRVLKESSNNDAQIQKYQDQIDHLTQANHELDEENNILESKYMELENHCQELEAYCKELEARCEDTVGRQDFQNRLAEYEAKHHEQLQNQTVKYNELARQAELINQVYQENLQALQTATKRCQELQTQNKELQTKNNKLSEQNQQLAALIKDKNVEHLMLQIQQANKTIQKLLKECNSLKSKQIDLEVQDQKKRFEKSLGLHVMNDPRQNDALKQLIHEYKKKIKTLESQKKEVQQKYKKLKTQSSQLITEEVYKRKIDGLEKLTEKQQTQINRLIEAYDKQLGSVSKENIKLKEGYYSLSQQLSKKSMDLNQKERYINQLKYTTDRVFFENQSLKKVNSNLIDVNADRLKNMNMFSKEISHSESFTMMDKKTSQGISPFSQPSSIGIHRQPTAQQSAKSSVQAPKCKTSLKYKSESPDPDHKHMPITLNYSNPNSDQGDFKFIQSVNIINGYNVNLGEHGQKKKYEP